MSPVRIALATCAALPELDPDDRLVSEALRELGAHVTAGVWDDPAVDWATFDLVVIRSTWDYPARRADFLRWAASVRRLANRAALIAWNTDKRYLADLAATGLPVVPTRWVAPAETLELPAGGEHVIKPSVGAGSLDAERFNLDDPAQAHAARAHAERLLAAGRTIAIQPYVGAVDSHGETAIILIDGRLSHAIVKGPMLGAGGREQVAGLYRAESIAPRRPTPAELELASRTLAAIPGGPDDVLYARVDLLPGASGDPVIIELELTEPSLFLGTAAGSAQRFAEAILAHAARHA
ncbi:MAG TPA: hypothetical protein VNW68_08775 [Candidatus Limnocylindria bacterium]|nr:hypothetical protein [Candidatus Limnocylindria bacterium]